MKKFSLGILLLIFMLMLTGCIEQETSDTMTITDMIGRTVEVGKESNRIVCIGAGSLRLYSYIGDMNKLVGVEDVEKTRKSAVSIRPYQLANEAFFATLPTCGTGGPSGSADAEKILTCSPDLIISLYTSDVAAMDTLQSQTQTPVVTLSYGTDTPFNETTLEAISLLGKILGCESRAETLVNYIKSIINDIKTRTADIDLETAPTAYLGCNSSWGTHGLTSTNISYAPFKIANIQNAAALYLNSHLDLSAADIDLEALVDMDPDIIILDTGGLSILKSEYETNQTIIDSLSAVKNGNVYLQMPYNAYYTNIELALCNAYFIAKAVYPSAFTDIDITDKTNEILTTFLGTSVYDILQEEFYGGYQQITNLSEFFK